MGEKKEKKVKHRNGSEVGMIYDFFRLFVAVFDCRMHERGHAMISKFYFILLFDFQLISGSPEAKTPPRR